MSESAPASEPTPVESTVYAKAPEKPAVKITIAGLRAAGAKLRVRQANAVLARSASAPARHSGSRGRR